MGFTFYADKWTQELFLKQIKQFKMGFTEAVVYILLGLFVGFFCGLATRFALLCSDEVQGRRDIITIINNKDLEEVRKIITDLKYDRNSENN